MNNNLTLTILSKLKQSEYWTTQTRESGNTIQGLTCPVCGIPGSTWCYLSLPMSINCNRLNQCQARTKTLQLFNILRDIEKEFAPTKSDKKRPARVFLETRGIKQALNGLKYSYWPNIRQTGRGAVMFPVGKDNKGKTVYNGRLLNPRRKDGKTHNSGSTSGLFWQHPGLEYEPYKPVFITEGIIDTLSLIELGYQAIAVLASGQDPSKVDLSFFKKMIIAFDNDPAGTLATKKWIEHYPDAETIMPDKDQDWNDILCSDKLDKIKEQFEKDLQQYYMNANLALAKSARKYAEIYQDFYKSAAGLFVHKGCTFFASIKRRGNEDKLSVERCGRFTLQVISFYKDTSNPHNPEYRYQIQITPENGQPICATATGRDLATPRGLKEFFF